MNASSLGSANEALKVDELLARCMGNLDFATRVLATFQDRFEKDLEELERGLDARDVEAVAQVAHRIKGASANVAAHSLSEQAAAIEQLGRSQQVSMLPLHVQQLRDEWSRFVSEVSLSRLGSCNAP